MGRIPVNRKWRTSTFLNFSRGFGYPAREDAEAETFENIELQRDGSIMSRLGCFRHSTTALNENLIVGMGRGNVGLSGTVTDVLVVAKKGLTWNFTTAPYTPGPNVYTALTVLQDPGILPVIFEQANLDDATATPIIIFANANFAGGHGLDYWDGTTVVHINTPFNHTAFVRQSASHVYAVSVDLPNRVFFSDEGDPTTWPALSAFDIPSTRGPITGLERYASTTLLIFTDRAIWGVYGDPTLGPGSFNIEVLQDGIGTDTPRSVASLGSLLTFAWRGSLNSFSGAVQDMTEHLRSLSNAALTFLVPPPASTVPLVMLFGNNQSQSFSISDATGTLTAIGSPITPGLGGTTGTALPNAVSPNGSFIFTETGGPTASLLTYPINQTTGAMGAFVSVSGVNVSGNGGGPRAKSIEVSHNNLFLIVSDLQASSTIRSFSINQTTGALTSVSSFSGNCSTFLQHPTLDVLFVRNATAAQVQAVTFNSTTGAFTLVNGISGGATITLIGVSPDGRFLYAFCTSPFALVTFAINQTTGAISTSSTRSVGSFASTSLSLVSQNGDYIYVEQGTGFTIFPVNPSTGAVSAGAAQAQLGIVASPSYQVVRPTFVVVSRPVNSSANQNIQSFAVNPSTGVATALSAFVITSNNTSTLTAALSLSSDARFLFVTYRSTAGGNPPTVDVYPINANGVIGALVQSTAAGDTNIAPLVVSL